MGKTQTASQKRIRIQCQVLKRKKNVVVFTIINDMITEPRPFDREHVLPVPPNPSL